jgi:hypothetical protein
MTAMNWLAAQLAWEQRLVELRSGDRPTTRRAQEHTREAEAQRKAA